MLAGLLKAHKLDEHGFKSEQDFLHRVVPEVPLPDLLRLVRVADSFPQADFNEFGASDLDELRSYELHAHGRVLPGPAASHPIPVHQPDGSTIDLPFKQVGRAGLRNAKRAREQVPTAPRSQPPPPAPAQLLPGKAQWVRLGLAGVALLFGLVFHKSLLGQLAAPAGLAAAVYLGRKWIRSLWASREQVFTWLVSGKALLAATEAWRRTRTWVGAFVAGFKPIHWVAIAAFAVGVNGAAFAGWMAVRHARAPKRLPPPASASAPTRLVPVASALGRTPQPPSRPATRDAIVDPGDK